MNPAKNCFFRGEGDYLEEYMCIKQRLVLYRILHSLFQLMILYTEQICNPHPISPRQEIAQTVIIYCFHHPPFHHSTTSETPRNPTVQLFLLSIASDMFILIFVPDQYHTEMPRSVVDVKDLQRLTPGFIYVQIQVAKLLSLLIAV